jgi:hypothetical protein
VLAEGIEYAYRDLYQLNRNAHDLSTPDIKGKMKTLTQGQFSDAVLTKMSATFKALAAQADFSAVEPAPPPTGDDGEVVVAVDELTKDSGQSVTAVRTASRALSLGGLVYNIQIQLPESRDPAVYDALFRSLRTHLFDE